MQVLSSGNEPLSADSAYLGPLCLEILDNSPGTAPAPDWGMVARRFEDLRAWQLARVFKLGIYQLIEGPPLSHDENLAGQLREAARSAVSQITEGFGRFDPLDFARFVKMARASLIECKNHLIDAVDRRLISEDVRREHADRADAALAEIGG